MSFPTTLLSNIHHVLPHRTSPLVLPSGGNPTCGQWARRGAASGCLLVSRYLHRTPPGPHIQSHTHTLPLHPTTLHSHLPDHTPTLIVISILAINRLSRERNWASSQPLLRISRPSSYTRTTPQTPTNTQPPHPLTKYTQEPQSYPPPPLTKERLSAGIAQLSHRLVSPWCPFSIHSSKSLACIV